MLTDNKDILKNRTKYPFINVEEDISIKPLQNYSFFQKIGLVSALIISIILFIVLLFSLYIDVFIKSNYTYGFYDLIILTMIIYALYFLLDAYKSKIVTDALIDTAFQEGIYSRLEPLVDNIARAHVDTNILLEKMRNLDLKVQNISKERYQREITTNELMQEPIAIGTSIKFTVKSIFLITLTMAIFMFLVNFNIGWITQFAVLSIFFLWWGLITNEYKLWKDNGAWAFVFFPILVLPVTAMLLNDMVNYNVLIAILYFSVGAYTFLYYLWANYSTTGSLPFVVPVKQKPEKGNFFQLQEKGLVNELLDAASSKMEQELQKEEKHKGLKNFWKKNK